MRRILKSPLVFGLLLLGGAGTSLLVADGINPPPTHTAGTDFVRVDTTRKSRVLILLIDSWRHQTAEDSTIMPAVARLSRDGASGKIETVFEGFSIPAIRSAFSGSAPTQLMNLVRNFRFRALPIESAFLDASRIGKRSLVIGDEVFTQFGSSLERRTPGDKGLDMYGLDRLRPAMALDAYRSGTYDLVICHFETADWRAHEVGVNSSIYAAAFARADSVVADFASALRPGDYLIVFGDHGHNERGEHKTGIYIPTHGLFIGPDIKPGVVFPSIPIGDMRVIIDHALGIELRAPALETERLARFLPVETAAASPSDDATSSGTTSRRPLDYLLFALFLAAFVAAIRVATSGDHHERLLTPSIAIISMLFVIEVLAQQFLHPAWSIFPFVMVVVGAIAFQSGRSRGDVHATSHHVLGAIILTIALYFVSRFAPSADTASLIRAPAGPASIIPLYVAGSCAKLAILVAITGWRRWLPLFAAALLTTALAMLEFRVWDYPAVYIVAIIISALALLKFRTGQLHQLALVAFGYSVLYFTLRLPLYEYPWVDMFILAVLLASRAARGPWLDALVITGAFALTSLWLPSGLEWGFLYGLFPAYVIELQVGWFVPAILLKLPLLLLLTFWATNTRPSRRFIALLLTYAGIRLTGVWLVRLAGAPGAEVWPLAEQGLYLTTFAVAAVWLGPGISSAKNQQPMTNDRLPVVSPQP